MQQSPSSAYPSWRSWPSACRKSRLSLCCRSGEPLMARCRLPCRCGWRERRQTSARVPWLSSSAIPDLDRSRFLRWRPERRSAGPVRWNVCRRWSGGSLDPHHRSLQQADASGVGDGRSPLSLRFTQPWPEKISESLSCQRLAHFTPHANSQCGRGLAASECGARLLLRSQRGCRVTGRTRPSPIAGKDRDNADWPGHRTGPAR